LQVVRASAAEYKDRTWAFDRNVSERALSPKSPASGTQRSASQI
jgi:hypothetical protein